MKEQLQTLAAISRIDVELEELQEELGDLPMEVKRLEKDVRARQYLVDSTQQQIDEVGQYRSDMRVRTQEIHDREKRLSEQQFQVRNNREFDAITHEVQAIKGEARDIEREIATSNLTEENLAKAIAVHQEELTTAKERLAEKELELVKLSGNHNDEVTALINKRTELLSTLPKQLVVQYERIREYHTNTAVVVRRNSCSGCFNSLPPQKLVEIRAYKAIFTCENCGRIVFPEDMDIPNV
jgi:predicted  nucleic acid-binding Zn-ribbon protein